MSASFQLAEDSDLPPAASLPVPANDFYAEYHGHPLAQLRAVVEGLREQDRSIVWLAGDSTLDNKHWLFTGANKSDPRHLENTDLADDAIGSYQTLLAPPRMVRDMAFWLNDALRGSNLCCVNVAIEESTLADRRAGKLLPHDLLIRNCLQPTDVLVVSVGGNDVALRPTLATRHSMSQLLTCPEGTQEFAIALEYFVDLFKGQTEEFIRQLIARNKFQAVVVCMLHYLDEKPGAGWCEAVLGQMGYNHMPEQLQGLICTVYESATKHVVVPGTQVIPLPFYSVLDGKSTGDYCQRVEPSVAGGRKMAQAIADAISRSVVST